MSHKHDLFDVMRAARAHLETAVAPYRDNLDAQLGAPGDDWTARDAIAHIALWERMAVRKIAGTPLPDGEEIAAREPWNLDAFNDAMRDRWRTWTDAAILGEFADAHDALLAAVASTSDDNCSPGAPAWRAIDDDGAGHYHWHFPIPDLMAERWPEHVDRT